MREEYQIQRQGRTHVLWPGLLNEVHDRFDSWRIDTELVQIPVEGGEKTGEQFAIVKAVFDGKDKDGRIIKTSGIGTAGRKSDLKARDTQPAKDAPIEMAETRAKARALRDAVNVGETAFEELPQEDSSQPPSNTSSKAPNSAPKPRGGSNPTPTPQQGPGTIEGEYDEEPGSISKSTLGRLKYQIGEYSDLKNLDADNQERGLCGHIEVEKLEELSEYQGHQWIARYQTNIQKAKEEAS